MIKSELIQELVNILIGQKIKTGDFLMWQDRLKEIIYILENSNVNEIEVSFWGRKYRVVKEPNTVSEPSQFKKNQRLFWILKRN